MPYFNSGHFNSNNFLCNCRSLNGIIAKVKPDVLFPPYKQKLINRSIKQTEKQSFFVYNLCQSSPSLFFYDLLVSRKCSFSILVNYHFQVSFNLMKFCTLPKELKMPWLICFMEALHNSVNKHMHFPPWAGWRLPTVPLPCMPGHCVRQHSDVIISLYHSRTKFAFAILKFTTRDANGNNIFNTLHYHNTTP